MSRLESNAQPAMTRLLTGERGDIAFPMQKEHQTAIALWAMKTAMISEDYAPPPPMANGRHFYSREQCEQLRINLAIPARTIIWLSRFSGVGLWGTGTHLWNVERGVLPVKGFYGYTWIYILDHLAVQVITFRSLTEDSAATIPVPENNAPFNLPWTEFSVPIWPIVDTVWWPPARTFRENGPLSVAALLMRFKTGRKAA